MCWALRISWMKTRKFDFMVMNRLCWLWLHTLKAA